MHGRQSRNRKRQSGPRKARRSFASGRRVRKRNGSENLETLLQKDGKTAGKLQPTVLAPEKIEGAIDQSS